VHDTQRRRRFSGGAQRGRELLLVGIGGRQPENLMLLVLRCQRVDQRLDRLAIIADQQPGRRLAGIRIGGRGSGLLPTDLIAVVRDGLRIALLVVLCGKLCQHLHGLAVSARPAE
jgi:hypothetical protein